MFSFAVLKRKENTRLQIKYSENSPTFCIDFHTKKNFTFGIRGNWNHHLGSRWKKAVISPPTSPVCYKENITNWHGTQNVPEIIPVLTTKLLRVVITTGIGWNFMIILNKSLLWYKIKCSSILWDVCRIKYNGNKIMCQEPLASDSEEKSAWCKILVLMSPANSILNTHNYPAICCLEMLKHAQPKLAVKMQSINSMPFILHTRGMWLERSTASVTSLLRWRWLSQQKAAIL